jgi:hypothetical protein
MNPMTLQTKPQFNYYLHLPSSFRTRLDAFLRRVRQDRVNSQASLVKTAARAAQGTTKISI